MGIWLKYSLLCTCLLLSSSACASTSSSINDTAENKQTINHIDAIILGLVEGITEYLPISSTGHLIITNRTLGLDNEQSILPDSEYNLKQAADAYAIIIQIGAIIAVLLLYWQRVYSIILGVLGKNETGRMLAKNLIIAFLPAVFLGLAFDDLIERYLFNTSTVIVALVAGAILMLGVEYWRKGKEIQEGPDLHELSIRQALLIGLLQCVAMWPGTSRSMMTIVGGYIAGLSPVKSAEFSFLLGLITLSAASVYKMYSTGPELLQVVNIGPMLTGVIISTITAVISVRWLVNYLTKHGLAIFAWYRIALAIVLIIHLR